MQFRDSIRDYYLLLSHAFLPSANIICATKVKSRVIKKIMPDLC